MKGHLKMRPWNTHHFRKCLRCCENALFMQNPAIIVTPGEFLEPAQRIHQKSCIFCPRLRYNRTTRTSHNAEGVNIHIINFGNTSTVEYLDPDRFSSFSYFNNLIEVLVSHNYTRNKNIKGAPYDFRYAANQLGEFYKNLTRLIEDTYAENNNIPVVVIAHSMGNPVMLYFYNHKPQPWKDKYIRAHVSMSGVWAGAVKPVRLMTSGDKLGVFIVDPLVIRSEQRSMPSTAWLMPSQRYWLPDEPLVITPNRNYSVADYKQLFADLNYTDGYSLWQDTHQLIFDLKAPQVEFHALYGYGLETPGILQFSPGGFPDQYPKVIPDDGDGTVNIRSLKAFLREEWGKKQKQPVKYAALQGAEHVALLKDPRAFEYIVNLLTAGL